MSDSLIVHAGRFPDGYYRLKTNVVSPLPARITGSRRRSKGWAKGLWHQHTEFKVEAGLLTCVTFNGVTPKLSSNQRAAVALALEPYLEPIPTLPSHLLKDTSFADADETLDALYALGKITLDDIREARTALDAASALQWHARDLGELASVPEPATATSTTKWSTQPTPSREPRLGDVIAVVGGELFVNVSVPGTQPRFWQSHWGHSVSDPWKGPREEPIVGHVADMLAEGLATFTKRSIEARTLGYDATGAPVGTGDVLRMAGTRLRVTGLSPSQGYPHVLFTQLSGPKVGFEHATLNVSPESAEKKFCSKWIVERPATQPAVPSSGDPFSLD